MCNSSGMRKFILQILLFFILLCIIALPVDYMTTKGLRKLSTIEFAVWNDIYNDNHMDNDLVVLGASTAWTGYNTYMMDSILGISTYNLGVDGHPWYMYKVRYEVYREVAKAPKYIVINLDKATFLDALDNPYMREQFLPYPRLMWKVRKDKEFSLIELCVPYYRYIGYKDLQKAGLQSYYDKPISCFDTSCNFYKGYWGQDKKWSVEVFDSTDITSAQEMSCSKLVQNDIADFIQQRQDEGITVILCKYPLYRPYFENCRNIEEYQVICEDICKETGVVMYDFTDMLIVEDTAYFYNPTHLNLKGSTIFTNEFCAKLNENELNKEDNR